MYALFEDMKKMMMDGINALKEMNNESTALIERIERCHVYIGRVECEYRHYLIHFRRVNGLGF